MQKLLKYLLLFLLIPVGVEAQDKDEELLNWNASRKLNWADYKASPDPGSDAAASTTTYLGIEYNITPNNFSYKIQSRFSRTRSWGLHKTAYILSHEQGHFDIAEIFARKLHQKMSAYKFNSKTFRKDLKKIYEEITKEKEDMQNEYDKETRHSIHKGKQAEWLKNIEQMLEEYEPYKNY